MKPETNKQVQGLIAASIPFLLLEVRGAKCEVINYTDKKTRQPAMFSFTQFACESLGQSAEAIAVRTRMDDEHEATKDGLLQNKKTKEIVPFPFKKGDQVLVTFRTLTVNNGAKQLEAIQILAA